MNDDIMVNGEPMGLAAVGTTDVHVRGIPLIEPRRKKVRVSAVGKAPPRRKSSRVNVRRVRIGGKPATGDKFFAHVRGCEAESA